MGISAHGISHGVEEASISLAKIKNIQEAPENILKYSTVNEEHLSDCPILFPLHSCQDCIPYTTNFVVVKQ